MKIKERISEFPFTLITGFIVLGIINAVLRSALSVQNFAVLIAVIVFFVILHFTKCRLLKTIRKIKPIYIYIFFGICGAISMLIFEPVLWDDPLLFSENVKRDITEGTIKYNDFYSIRGIVFLYPVYKIFGSNMMILQIINLLVYILTGIIFNKILEKTLSKDRALLNIGIILIYSIPTLLYSINIPLWELTSFFYQILTLYFLSSMFEKVKNKSTTGVYNLVIHAIILGVCYTGLFYSRGLQTVMIITSLVFCLIMILSKGFEKRLKINVLIYSFLVPFIIYFATDAFLKSTSFIDKTDYGRSTAQMLFSYNDTRADGTNEHHDKKWVYFQEIPKELKNEYAFKKINSEIYYNWPWYLFRLNTKSVNNYTLKGFNDWVIKNSQYENIISILTDYWDAILQYIILILCISGFYYYTFRNKKKTSLFMMFTAAYIFVCTFFSLFSEANTRYSLVFIYGLIVFALLGLKELATERKITKRDIKVVSINYGIVFVFFVFIFFAYRITIAKNYKFEQINEWTYNKEIGKINLTAFQKQIKSEDRKIILDIPDNSKRLNFFLRSGIKNIERPLIFEINDGTKHGVNVDYDKFKKLKTDSTVAAAFLEIDIENKQQKQISIEFPENMAEGLLIVEYVSFN